MNNLFWHAALPQAFNNLPEQVLEYWEEGQPLEAGKLIFESLPSDARPKWAAQILSLVLDRSGIRMPLFDELLAVAECQDMWQGGHRLFSALRVEALKLQKKRRRSGLSEDEGLLNSIPSLAELVAKVVYNSSNPLDDFDEDSGWWIPVCLRAFMDHKWRDKEFAAAAWSALFMYQSDDGRDGKRDIESAG